MNFIGLLVGLFLIACGVCLGYGIASPYKHAIGYHTAVAKMGSCASNGNRNVSG